MGGPAPRGAGPPIWRDPPSCHETSLDFSPPALYQENICQGGFHHKDEIPPLNKDL